MTSNILPDPKSAGGDDIVDLSRYDAKTRNGSGRIARMYHDVLDFVDDSLLEEAFFSLFDLEPILKRTTAFPVVAYWCRVAFDD